MTHEVSNISIRRRFVGLMRELWRHEDVSYAEEIVTGQSGAIELLLSVGEADVRIKHSHKRAAQAVLEFDFGALPETCARDALLHLLEMNGGLNQRGGIGCGMDTDGATVIYREPVDLEGLDCRALVSLLRERGELSAIWFESWHPDPTASGSSYRLNAVERLEFHTPLSQPTLQT